MEMNQHRPIKNLLLKIVLGMVLQLFFDHAFPVFPSASILFVSAGRILPAADTKNSESRHFHSILASQHGELFPLLIE
jgi:hypothetical protein